MEAHSESVDDVGWHKFNSGDHLHPVGAKRANGFGLYDIWGNASEWVNDWYDENYYQSSPLQDPAGPATGKSRALRGGSCFDLWDIQTVSHRNMMNPGKWSSGVGFRCAGKVFAP